MTKSLFSKRQSQRAFTLLELLIVMIILAILAGLGLVAFGTAQEKARDSRRKQDLSAIVKALDTYYNDFGKYPGSSGGSILGCGDGGDVCSWGQAWENNNGTLYMTQIPKDPAGDYSYFYQAVGSGTGYYLFAYLENLEDPEVAMNGATPSFYLGATCKGGVENTCNYVVKSTNLVNDPSVL